MDETASPQQASSKRLWSNDWALFEFVVLVALLIRVVYVLQMRENPLFAHPTMDELYHDQ